MCIFRTNQVHAFVEVVPLFHRLGLEGRVYDEHLLYLSLSIYDELFSVDVETVGNVFA